MFIFNDISSKDMNLIVKELPPISSFDEKINSIKIPGMDGALLQSDGFEMLDKKVLVHYIGNKPHVLLKWLRGAGKVIFENNKDVYYKAYINNKIPLEEVLRNQLYYFPIIFSCQPFGYLAEGDNTITLNSPITLYNSDNTHESYPTITIKGTGATKFTINNRSFNITNIDGEITIISEPRLKLVLNNKGQYMEGEFPYLDTEENYISWTGNVTSVEIVPYWRTLA